MFLTETVTLAKQQPHLQKVWKSQAGEAHQPPQVLDLRGLRCPLPALKTRRALIRGRAGAFFVVISDDPLARIDVPNAVREAGGEIVSAESDGPAIRFAVRKLNDLD